MIAQLPMKPEWQNQATNRQLVLVRFCACNFGAGFASIDMAKGKAVALIGSMRTCKRETFIRCPSLFSIDPLATDRTRCQTFQPHRP